VEGGSVLRMLLPGANRSTVLAPKFENKERLPVEVIEPTEMTFGKSAAATATAAATTTSSLAVNRSSSAYS
jgi:hypothetical protein